MSERTLKIPVEVRNFIKRLHPELKRKIRAALRDILENPSCGKSLKEELEGYWFTGG
jgi:mRNA interferase RelE/StbE